MMLLGTVCCCNPNTCRQCFKPPYPRYPKFLIVFKWPVGDNGWAKAYMNVECMSKYGDAYSNNVNTADEYVAQVPTFLAPGGVFGGRLSGGVRIKKGEKTRILVRFAKFGDPFDSQILSSSDFDSFSGTNGALLECDWTTFVQSWSVVESSGAFPLGIAGIPSQLNWQDVIVEAVTHAWRPPESWSPIAVAEFLESVPHQSDYCHSCIAAFDSSQNGTPTLFVSGFTDGPDFLIPTFSPAGYQNYTVRYMYSNHNTEYQLQGAYLVDSTYGPYSYRGFKPLVVDACGMDGSVFYWSVPAIYGEPLALLSVNAGQRQSSGYIRIVEWQNTPSSSGFQNVLGVCADGFGISVARQPPIKLGVEYEYVYTCHPTPRWVCISSAYWRRGEYFTQGSSWWPGEYAIGQPGRIEP